MMNEMTTAKGTKLPLLNLRGKPYLQVAHRIVWFREEHPNWLFNVEFIKMDEKSAIAKATISDDDGKIKSVAHKVEHAAHFGDFIEKAETGAIGRALALIGYGTQFAPDIDEEERLADSPIDPAKKNQKKKDMPAPKPNEIEKAKQEAEAVKQDPGNYIFKKGSFSGKKIKELTPLQLREFSDGVKTTWFEANKLIPADIQVILDLVKAYLENLEMVQ